jgi:hypothetical protein
MSTEPPAVGDDIVQARIDLQAWLRQKYPGDKPINVEFMLIQNNLNVRFFCQRPGGAEVPIDILRAPSDEVGPLTERLLAKAASTPAQFEPLKV